MVGWSVSGGLETVEVIVDCAICRFSRIMSLMGLGGPSAEIVLSFSDDLDGVLSPFTILNFT